MLSFAIYIAVLLPSDAPTEAWSSFRNGGQSRVTGSLPQRWSPADVAWQCELPGYGQSSPVIYGDAVFVTAAIGPKKEKCGIGCYDLATGTQRWWREFAAATEAPSNYMQSRGAPTPVVDERGVYAFFESGNLVALNLRGELLWQRSLTRDYGEFDTRHGLGSSPAQTADSLFLHVEHSGPSYLIAIDKVTGDTRWKTSRKSSSSWSSPIIVERAGERQVVVSSGGSVAAYDAETGRDIWSFGDLDGNSVPSPTLAGEHLVIGARIPEFGNETDAGRSNLCLLVGNPPSGASVAWRASKGVCDYASPVVSEGCVYLLNRIGVLYCLDLATGNLNYSLRIGTQCWCTPIVSKGSVYFFGKDGVTVVIRSGPEFEQVAVNRLWDPNHAPLPEAYREHQGDRGRQPRGESRRPLTADSLLAGDKDGDGQLAKSELPPALQAAFPSLDKNADGVLDRQELLAMENSFRERRAGSREAARDPIVYGAAAVDNTIVIRTGTRLYVVRQ